MRFFSPDREVRQMDGFAEKNVAFPNANEEAEERGQRTSTSASSQYFLKCSVRLPSETTQSTSERSQILNVLF